MALGQKEHLPKILIAFTGLILSLNVHGEIQDFIMTQRYTHKVFPSHAFLIMTECCMTTLVAWLSLLISRESIVPAVVWKTAAPSFAVCAGSWCQHLSFRFLSFPMQMWLESFKTIPTMWTHTLINGVRYAVADYSTAIALAFCVGGFIVSTENSVRHVEDASSAKGVVLSILYLCFGGLALSTEKLLYDCHPKVGTMHVLFGVCLHCSLFSAFEVYFTCGFGAIFEFYYEHSEAVPQTLLLSSSSVIGHFLMCYVVQYYGPVMLAIMLTARQVLGVIVSVYFAGCSMGPISDSCAAGTIISLGLSTMQLHNKEFHRLSDSSVSENADFEEQKM